MFEEKIIKIYLLKIRMDRGSSKQHVIASLVITTKTLIEKCGNNMQRLHSSTQLIFRTRT